MLWAVLSLLGVFGSPDIISIMSLPILFALRSSFIETFDCRGSKPQAITASPLGSTSRLRRFLEQPYIECKQFHVMMSPKAFFTF
jgi:hypothetical protein